MQGFKEIEVFMEIFIVSLIQLNILQLNTHLSKQFQLIIFAVVTEIIVGRFKTRTIQLKVPTSEGKFLLQSKRMLDFSDVTQNL